MIINRKLNVGVIFGGTSGEHEVSLVSAQSVIDSLNRNKYNVIPIGISKTGKWITDNQSIKLLKLGKVLSKNSRPLMPEPSQGVKTGYQNELDLVFPLVHGPYGEDGTLQGLLKLADLPYVGAGVLASACGMDKVIMKILFRNSGLRVPDYVHFLKHEWRNNKNSIIDEIESKLKYPVFTKPANLGSSIGISRCEKRSDLIKGINEALVFDRKIIVETGIKGREIECAVLGHNRLKASLPGEIKPKRKFYDYEAKYVTEDSELIIPAKLNKKQIVDIQAMSIKAFKSIDCSGLARVDFFIENKTNIILVNEINTMPGFTKISMYPKLWAASGLTYGKLLDKLIELAIEKHKEEKKLKKSVTIRSRWYK